MKVLAVSGVALLLSIQTNAFGSYSPLVMLASGGVIFFVVRNWFGVRTAAQISTGHAHVHGRMSGEALRKFIARHEGGHYAGAKRSGGKNVSAQIWDNGGATWGDLPRGDIKARLVTLYAGQYAVGSSYGADWDNNEIKKLQRRLPKEGRKAIIAEIQSEAHAAARSSEVDRVAKKLVRNGRA